MRRASIDHKLRLLKFHDLAAKGQSAGADAASVVLLPEEYAALLTRAYKEEKFPKPLNLIGLEKDLPVSEMEKLMLTNAQVSDVDLVALGDWRAQNVKDWLVKNGQVPAERIYITASKNGSGESEKSGGPKQLRSHRVDFSLR